MAFIRVTVPTPHAHPGWKDYFFESTADDHGWIALYKKHVAPEPPLGQAWDAATRLVYAQWKADFVEWLRQQDGIRPLHFINM